MTHTFISSDFSNDIGGQMNVVPRVPVTYCALKGEIKQRNLSRFSRNIFKHEIKFPSLFTQSLSFDIGHIYQFSTLSARLIRNPHSTTRLIRRPGHLLVLLVYDCPTRRTVWSQRQMASQKILLRGPQIVQVRQLCKVQDSGLMICEHGTCRI